MTEIFEPRESVAGRSGFWVRESAGGEDEGIGGEGSLRGRHRVDVAVGVIDLGDGASCSDLDCTFCTFFEENADDVGGRVCRRECALSSFDDEGKASALEEIERFLNAELSKGGEKELRRIAVVCEENLDVELGVGDVAPSAARNRELLSAFSILFEDEDSFAEVSGSTSSHKTGRTAADDDHVEMG